MKKMLLALITSTLLLVGCGSNNKTALNEKNQFIVGMECGYAPFNWQTSLKSDYTVSLGGAGYADGYDVLIDKKIADSLGKELVIKKISWDGLILALDSGEIDAVIAGMTANEAREEGADFTTPYYDSKGMIMIVRKNSEEAKFKNIQQFTGKKVIGQKGTNYDDVIDQIKGVWHVTPKSTYPEMVVALQQGDVDGITAEIAVAEGILAAHDDLTVVEFDKGKGFKADTTVSIALKEGTRNSEFFQSVQDALDKISTDERKQMMQEAVERQSLGNEK